MYSGTPNRPLKLHNCANSSQVVSVQTVAATPSGIKLFFKGGVYETRETVWAFRGAETRSVAG